MGKSTKAKSLCQTSLDHLRSIQSNRNTGSDDEHIGVEYLKFTVDGPKFASGVEYEVTGGRVGGRFESSDNEIFRWHLSRIHVW